MVEEHLLARGISDKRVLKAFEEVPREDFVPESLKFRAYEDNPLPIGEGQTISQPYTVAAMTELLELKGDEKVLEIGAGSGYQAAILSNLAKKVVTIERIEKVADLAKKNLKNYGNVKVVVGDGTKGFVEEAPFDAIIVTAGAPSVPESLKEQLVDGGRLVIPVGSMRSQKMLKIIRKGDEFLTEEQFDYVFVPLMGEEGW